MDLETFFKFAMKRTILPIKNLGTNVVNLGCGPHHIPGAENLDLPQWDARRGIIPFPDNSADTVLAFHFLEHLTGDEAIQILREIQRILKPQGTCLICVPHSSSIMAFQDLDHKSFWNEETFKELFFNAYYSRHNQGWQFDILTNIIMGITSRNLALLVQLEKRYYENNVN